MRALWRACALLMLTVAPQARGMDLPLPPMNATGAVTYSLHETKAPQDAARNWRHTVTGTVNPSTYIYAPWLATLTGSVNASTSMSTGQSSGTSQYLTGNISLGVLPRSQYPVELTYSRYDSSITLGETSADLTGDTVRLISRIYLPLDWKLQTDLGALRNRSDEGMNESATEAQLQVDKQYGDSDVRLTLLRRDSELKSLSGNGEIGSRSGFTLRHRGKPLEDVSTDSTSTVHYATYETGSYRESSLVSQGVGTGFWRPRKWENLTLFGALRTYQQSSDVDLLLSRRKRQALLRTVFGNVTASYIFRPRLIGNLGLNLGIRDTVTTATGEQRQESSGLDTGLNGGVDYGSLTRPVLGFDWNWTTGANMRAEYNDSGTRGSTNIRAGHSGRRSLEIPIFGPASLGLSQGGSVGLSQEVGAAFSLSHSINLGRSHREGKHWNHLNVTASDTRTIARGGYAYQLINSQFTRGYDPDRFSSWSGSANLQIYRQESDGTPSEGWVDQVSGTVTYRARNILGLTDLNFASELSFNPPSFLRSRRDEFSGFSQLQPEDEGLGTQRWSNRFDYFIGKLRISLLGVVRNSQAGMGETILFQLSRAFF